MQQNVMLPDQGELLLRCSGYLVREQEEKEERKKKTLRKVEEKPGQGSITQTEGLQELDEQRCPV